MNDDRDAWRGFKRLLALVAGAGYLGFAIPANLSVERQAIRQEGVIVRYETSASGRYFYPIVRLKGQDSEFELKGTASWYWAWYEIGSRVPVLNLPGRRCLVGSVWVRWSGVLFTAGALPLIALWTMKSRAKA